MPMPSSTGLPSPTAAALAYAGWWMTGAIFWFVERRDRYVRFHAAQSTILFGAVAALICLCLMLAVLSLSFLPWAFSVFVIAGALTWLAGVIVWGVALWKASSGDEWRIPVAADLADRFVTASAAASS
jgi:uncharacterized membrane protein